MGAVINRRHRLGIPGFEEPAILDPTVIKIGVETRQTGQKPGQQFCFGQAKIFVVRWQVVAAVNDVVIAVMATVDVVGMLDQGQEGEPFLFGDVDPIMAVG